METIIKNVEVKDFSKDHWSLLGYIESRVHDFPVMPNTGALAQVHLRINGNKRILRANSEWKPEYGTRLAGFWNKDTTLDETKRLSDHDDIDCLNDLEAASIIKIISDVNFYIELTKKGQKIATELREWKNAGNMYFNFTTNIQQ